MLQKLKQNFGPMSDCLDHVYTLKLNHMVREGDRTRETYTQFNLKKE